MTSLALVVLLAFTPMWGDGELNRSPWHLHPTTGYATYSDLNKPYSRISREGVFIAEGVDYLDDAPRQALPRGPEGAALRRMRRYTYHGRKEQVHLAYGVFAGEARAWVTVTDARGERLVYRGRAERRDLVVLAEYAYEHEVWERAMRAEGDLPKGLPRRFFPRFPPP